MEKIKSSQNVSVKQIVKHFWIATKTAKLWFFLSYFLFIVSQIISILTPLYYKSFFDILAQSGDRLALIPALNKIILSIVIVKILRQTISQVAQKYFQKMQTRVMPLLKQNAFDYLMLHSYSFFTNNFTGSLVQKINRFSRAFESITDNLVFEFTPLVIAIVGSIWVTYFYAPIVSFILIIWVVLFIIFSIFIARWKIKYDVVVAEADSKSSGYLSDSISNNNAISLFTGNIHESRGYRDVSDDQANKKYFSWRVGSLIDYAQAILISFVEFFIFYYAIKYWGSGLITIGTFVLAQTYVINVADKMWGLNRIIRNFYESLADCKEIVDILETKHEVADITDAKNLSVSGGEIVFEKVSFEFNDDRKVLRDLNLTIKPKQRLAVVGPSGAGKTTLVRLIMRLYDIKSGTIKIDGQDIREVTQESLRHNISLVPQDPVLFHRTLMENIRYGRRDATDEEVIKAARLAHCSEFIDSLPNKYDTFVGERGIKLSGGERQRVAIARAILKKAPILIFDEATSSLDSHSEALIQDALENLMKESTTIVIAHRLSTIKKMDRIISMRDGKIVEDGSHHELSNRKSGLYKKLWDLQVSGFIDNNNQ